MKKNEVRLGIVGLGGMGTGHARQVIENLIANMRLTAVCDIAPDLSDRFPDQHTFHDPVEMFQSGLIDAVLIATPHYSHTPIGIAALSNDLHVLVEKPISVHKADCERLLAAKRSEAQVFAAMLNMRMRPAFQKLKQLIVGGELGAIRRIQWTITDWFRSHAYYQSGSWRGTWQGEGGGVLVNQCPHQLDLWQWLFGMPCAVYAKCNFGRYHDIEVEDEVVSLLHYEDGTIGTFSTSTGEAPGCNRLEIAGEKGLVTLEKGTLHFRRNEIETGVFSRTTRSRMGEIPPTWEIDIPIHSATIPERNAILQNFANAILHNEPLIAPAEEGIHSVELANAMLLSTLKGEVVTLPLNGEEVSSELENLVASSKYRSNSKKELALPA